MNIWSEITMEKKDFFEKEITYIKGVGPAKSLLLEKIGIKTVKDIVENYPRVYEDRTKLYHIKELELDHNCLFMATISSKKETKKMRNNLIIYTVYVSDGTGVCKMTWFNQKFVAQKLIEGNTYLFYGKPERKNGILTVEGANIYAANELEKVQGIYPIYHLTAGITQNYLFKLTHTIFDQLPLIDEIFSDEFRKKYQLVESNLAAKNIHFPRSFQDMNLARNRLIFEELFLFELALMCMKKTHLKEKKTTNYQKVDLKEFLNLLPFELTNAQKKVVKEIEQDLYSDQVMNRMVQGDVGSGKTMVAAISMYIAIKNGYQVALMAPTTILATQHYEELSSYFEKLGIRTEIITSSTTKKKKEAIVERLRKQEIDAIIGTHSLIEDTIEFANLGLVVTDEQHRFGVKQRVKLSSKGNSVETLVMTATPIPRSLAIILYGDLDISMIDEMPPGRSPVKTYALNDAYETRINEFIKKQVREGRQVYIVCPLVEESEDMNLKSVEALYEEYKNKVFSGLQVEFLHGKMKNKEKEEIMTRFKNNETNVLISTTVIEVGISVSNATLMVIENADRFGLAALHQLRGRVGRGAHQSYCILKSNNRSTHARERLKIMEKSNNGFEIAQKDLELRGPGDFFGIRQSGLPEFKLADLLKDVTILKQTTEAVKELLKEDETLEKHEKIKEALERKFGDCLKEIAT